MIVVAGESLVDLVPQRARSGSRRTAAAARSTPPARSPGWDSGSSFLGASPTTGSEAAARALTDDGVGVDTVVDTPLPTTLALRRAGQRRHRRLPLLHRWDRGGGADHDRALAALPESLDALVGGSFGLMLEPLSDAILAVLETDTAAAALTCWTRTSGRR